MGGGLEEEALLIPRLLFPFPSVHGAVAGVFGRVEVAGEAAARVHDDLAAFGRCTAIP
jgi:hypothetical protein